MFRRQFVTLKTTNCYWMSAPLIKKRGSAGVVSISRVPRLSVGARAGVTHVTRRSRTMTKLFDAVARKAGP
jgi:hypothetical protein